MSEDNVDKMEHTSENAESVDTVAVTEQSEDAKGIKGKIRNHPVSTKTKELIEIIIAIVILVFVFRLKSQGALDNPVSVLGNVLGF